MQFTTSIARVMVALIQLAHLVGAVCTIRYFLSSELDNPKKLVQVWAHDRRFEPVYQPLLFSVLVVVGALNCVMDLGEGFFKVLYLQYQYRILVVGFAMTFAAFLSAFIGPYIYICSGGGYHFAAVLSTVLTNGLQLYSITSLNEPFSFESLIEWHSDGTPLVPLSPLVSVLPRIAVIGQIPFAFWGARVAAKHIATVSEPRKAPASLSIPWSAVLAAASLLYVASFMVAATANLVGGVDHSDLLIRVLSSVNLNVITALCAIVAVKRSLFTREQYQWQWLSFLTPAFATSMVNFLAVVLLLRHQVPWDSFLSLLLSFCYQGTLGYFGGCVYVNCIWRRVSSQYELKGIQDRSSESQSPPH